MAQVPTGTTFALCTAFGSALPVSLITNAAEAVCTSTAHGLSNGDLVEVSCGWSRVNGRAARVKSVTANNFTLEGIDTSNASLFVAGGGVGSVRKANTFVQFLQVLTVDVSGGTPKTVSYKYIESENTQIINDGFEPVNRTFTLDADFLDSSAYGLLKPLFEAQSTTMLRTLKRNGKFTLLPCTASINVEETMTDGQVNAVSLAISGLNTSTRY